MLKLLVCCEESQRVCTAFRERGWEAYSCDIEPCSGSHPEWHIQQDVLPILNGNCKFQTADGQHHEVEGAWDLIIAHPPCTRLCSSGQRWLYYGTEEYRNKKKKEQQEGIDFFMKFTNTNCKRVAIENPVGIMSNIYKKPSCIYNPYDFEDETECKKTCLWLKGLPVLTPTRQVPLPKEERTQGIWKAKFNGKQLAWNSSETAKMRSKTPKGVAKAMAEQWGKFIEEQV